MAKKKKEKVWQDEPTNYAVKSAFRALFFRSGLYHDCLELAKSELKGPRGGKLVVCAECGKSFSSANVAVDHIQPVIPFGKTVNDMSVQEMYDAVFCVGFKNRQDNLQALCKKKKGATVLQCHDIKTKEERAERKLAKERK